VTNFVWELPKLSGWNAVLKQVAGGWQLSGIFNARSGAPFGISGGNGNRSGTFLGQRADYVPGQDPWYGVGSLNDQLNRYFNTAAFQPSAPGTLGNTPRALFHGTPVQTLDAGVSKSWFYRERYRLQFRWEMFGALNNPSFGNPNNNPQSSNFGKITSASGSRIMQGALKFYF
jgi:hypothetical protein